MKVRSQVFETNSSSSHSLVLNPTMTEMVDPPLPEHIIKSGVFVVYPQDFGWEIEDYNDVDTKASYLYADACQHSDDDFDPNDEITRTNNEKLKIIEEAFRRYAGVGVFFEKRDGKNEYYRYGSIDHQSVGECEQIWEEGVNGVIRFLFSRASTLHIDNDNH